MNRSGTGASIAVIMAVALFAALGFLNSCGDVGSPPPPPSDFLLTAPSNTTSVGVGPNPTLMWEDASGETGYTVQISTSQTFTGNTYSVLLSANETSYLITTPTYSLVLGTQYYWKVCNEQLGSDQGVQRAVHIYTLTSGVLFIYKCFLEENNGPESF